MTEREFTDLELELHALAIDVRTAIDACERPGVRLVVEAAPAGWAEAGRELYEQIRRRLETVERLRSRHIDSEADLIPATDHERERARA